MGADEDATYTDERCSRQKDRSGKPVIEVNPESTPITDIADIFLAGPSGEVLPRLVALLKQKRK